MNLPFTVFSAGCFLASMLTCLPARKQPSERLLAHTSTEFSFTVNAPFEQTAPLFGADKERLWAPQWSPQFIHPTPFRDQQGMVFQVAHGRLKSTWVNTIFDLPGGHIQYAYVLGDVMATTIDIRLERAGAKKTGVIVVYERTALLPEANEHVQHFAKNDQKAGKEWEEQIDRYLATQK